MDGEAGQLLDGFEIQLLFDVVAMGGNGFHAEVKPVGYLVGRIAIADQLKHLQLAVTQLLSDAGELPFRRVAAETVHNRILDLLAQASCKAKGHISTIDNSSTSAATAAESALKRERLHADPVAGRAAFYPAVR